MLGFTVLLSMYVKASPEATAWVYNNIWLFYLCLVGFVAISFGLVCFWKKCRAFPLNIALLGMYTVLHAYCIAAIIPQYKLEAAVYAALSTLLMFVGLTAYACFTKTDLTYKGGLLCSAGMMIICFILFQMLIGYNKLLHLIICLVCVMFFSVWIIYDTQINVSRS